VLDHPGHESGYRAHDGTVDEAAEEGGSPKDDRLQAGGELVLEVASRLPPRLGGSPSHAASHGS